MLDRLAVASLQVFAQVPNPGQGKRPPGSEKVTTMLSWAAWIALVICVIGVIIAGASMAIQHRHGSGGENVTKLGWVLAGCIVVGSASAFVGALV